MKYQFRTGLLPFLIVFFFSPASLAFANLDFQWSAFDQLPEGIHTMVVRQDHLLVGTDSGLHVLLTDSMTWLPITGSEVSDYPCTAVGSSAGIDPDIIISAHLAPDGTAVLATTSISDLVCHERLSGLTGPISLVQDTGSYGDQILAVSPGNDGAGEVLSTLDAGVTWTLLTGHGLDHPRGVTSELIWVDRGLGAQIFLCGDEGVATSIDRGITFEPIMPYLAGHAIDHLAFMPAVAGLPKRDPVTRPTFAATPDGLFFNATDYNAHSWVNILPAPVVKTRFFISSYEQIPFVLTEDGHLLATTYPFAEAPLWQDITPAMTDEHITDYLIWGTDLLVATDQGRLLMGQRDPYPSSVPSADLNLRLEAAPNPFNPTTTLTMRSEVAGLATLRVYDLKGRRLATLFEGDWDGTLRTMPWSAPDLPSGVYLVRLDQGGLTAIRQVSLVR